MSVVPLITDAQAQGPVKEMFEKIRAALGVVPDAYRAFAVSPALLADMLDNHARLMAEGAVDVKTKELIALASSSVLGCKYCVLVHARIARKLGVSDVQIAEALGLAGVIAAHNHVQKFRDYCSDDELKTWWPKLTESLVKVKSLSDLQMELIFLGVSSINGCPTCVRVHTAKARKFGATAAQIQEAMSVVALMSMTTSFLKASGIEFDLK
jgi:AhpD family alkylhydroperoxidase